MERMSKQIEAIEEWRLQQIKLTRRVLRWLCLAMVLFALGIGVALWQIDNLVEANTKNIERQDAVDKQIVQEQYQVNLARWNTCTARNELLRQQLRQDKVQLNKVIAAHVKDGNLTVAKAWRDYLLQGQKVKPPNCGPEPAPPPIPSNS